MPLAFAPLTDTKISNAESRERPYKLFDDGRYAEVMADGCKLWRFKYIRPSRRESWLGIGRDLFRSIAVARTRSTRLLAPKPEQVVATHHRVGLNERVIAAVGR